MKIPLVFFLFLRRKSCFRAKKMFCHDARAVTSVSGVLVVYSPNQIFYARGGGGN
jgi:hypothetical protein